LAKYGITYLGLFYSYLSLISIFIPYYLKGKELCTDFLFRNSSIFALAAVILLCSKEIFLIFLSALLWTFASYYHYLAYYGENPQTKYFIYETLTRVGWTIGGICGYLLLNKYGINNLLFFILAFAVGYMFAVLCYRKEGILFYLEDIGKKIEDYIYYLRPSIIKFEKIKIRPTYIRGFLINFGYMLLFTVLNYLVVKNFGGSLLFLADTASIIANIPIYLYYRKKSVPTFVYSFMNILRGCSSFLLYFLTIPSIFIIEIAAGISWPCFQFYDAIIASRYKELGFLETFRSLGCFVGGILGGIIPAIFVPPICLISYIISAAIAKKE